MKQKLDRVAIAMRVTREFKDGDVVNLGVGMPTLCSSYLPQDRKVWLHAENGVLGYGPFADEGHQDPDLINASGQFVSPSPGISFFSSADAFNMIRGGHVDISVLGGFQVSEKGDLANWILPGRGSGNIGGAMELVTGAKKVIIAMEHTTKAGEPKLVAECAYPLTGKGCVDLIVTDLGVVEITEQGFLLLEIVHGFTPEEVQSVTGAPLAVSPDLREMEF
ncbi:MAG: 3-oxoacid CoA-transferase subunit B [Chloroflexi bacterium]|nr:3-oxoacid CoA-transferase subunit B [Chloroflexota bacterium]